MHNCICDYIVLGNLMFYDAAIVQQLYVESDSVTRQHGGASRQAFCAQSFQTKYNFQKVAFKVCF